MWTKEFWAGLGERAIKTFLQAGVATAITGGVVSGVSGIDAVNWLPVVSVAALATVLSVATSIGNTDFTSGKPAVTVITSDTGETVNSGS